MKKETSYIVFSVLFLLATVGIIGWIVKDEIDAGAREKQQQLMDSVVKDDFEKTPNIAQNDGSGETNNSESVESKADAKQALEDVDVLINSVGVDDLSL
jgi:hypothetical protein